MHQVLLLSKFHLNCLNNAHLSDDHKRFEREIMKDIGYNLLSNTLIRLYFLYT
jgi:hypothetical protein